MRSSKAPSPLRKAKCFVPQLWSLLLLMAIGCYRSPPPLDVVAISGTTMGTTYSVKIAGLPKSNRTGNIKAQIDILLEKIDQQMSSWRDDSEISLFNRHDGTNWYSVSVETATVVAEAQRISDLSGGAFDVTVAPLVNLWSFGAENRPHRIPSDSEIDEHRRRVNFRRLETRIDPPALRKMDGALAIDLSAIAPGFAVDKIAEYLETLHSSGFMVEIGGEVRCKGGKSNTSGWKIGIQSPKNGEQNLHRIITLRDRSLATSGDYHHFFEHEGKHYSHTIDPRIGRPVEHRLTSVSVVVDSCITADAFATVMMVLGPMDGYEFAVRNDLAVLMLVKEGDGIVEKATPAFRMEIGI